MKDSPSSRLVSTLKEVIRSVSFESESNWKRTISLSSSTTVDDISKIISLEYTDFTRVLKKGDELKGQTIMESLPLK